MEFFLQLGMNGESTEHHTEMGNKKDKIASIENIEETL
jgi:hypothetical protein